MAQILHKRTSTPAAAPTALQATVGELILNVNDGIVFTKKLDGTVVNIVTASAAAAGTLTGATLASGVLASSLTSVGTLAALTVTAPIVGSVTGSAATATSATTAGTVTTAAQPTITSVGTLASLTTSGTFTLDATALISATSATALAIQSAVPAGTGVTPTVQIICPSSATALTSGSAAQNVFSPVGYDTISAQASTTYMFDGQYIIKTTGTTTHTISMSFALSGGASVTDCSWTTLIHPQTATPVSAIRAQDANFFAAVAGGLLNSTNNSAFNIVVFRGMLRMNAAGNVVPQLTFSAAPGGTNTLEVGSYLRFYPIGSNTVNSVGTAIG